MANYQFYTVSSDAWDAMLAAIRRAKKSIYWESYIFTSTPVEYNFFQALKQKARSGVAVKIIIDSFGSFLLDMSKVDELRAAGVEVLFYNRLIPWWNPNRFKYWWFHRNHKKILIIDNAIGFIGGVNLAKEMKNWEDIQVELRGLIVRYLIRSFIVSYNLCGGRDSIRYQSVFRGRKVKVFHHAPLTEKGMLKKYYRQSLRSARKKIIIVTPYFMPQLWLIKRINQTLKRGVKIEVIFPQRTDRRLADFANYTFASLLYRPGIKFYLTKNMTHAKALLVDDREAMVGSQNIDAYSFDYNLEGGIVFERKDMLRQLKKIINQWKSDAQELKIIADRHWYHRLRQGILLLLSPYL